jgi:integrase/recombinase XerD
MPGCEYARNICARFYMLIRVERGKGGQYRDAMLPTDLLVLLRQWWQVGRQ